MEGSICLCYSVCKGLHLEVPEAFETWSYAPTIQLVVSTDSRYDGGWEANAIKNAWVGDPWRLMTSDDDWCPCDWWHVKMDELSVEYMRQNLHVASSKPLNWSSENFDLGSRYTKLSRFLSLQTISFRRGENCRLICMAGYSPWYARIDIIDQSLCECEPIISMKSHQEWPFECLKSYGNWALSWPNFPRARCFGFVISCTRFWDIQAQPNP